MIRPATHTDLEQIERLIQPYIADFAISREGRGGSGNLNNTYK